MVKTRKVMLLLKDPGLFEALSERLSKINCVVIDAPEEPLRKVYDEVPHLVVVDRDFMTGRGKTVAIEIKKDPILQHIPVMLLIRESETLPRRDFSKIDSYVVKEKDPDVLTEHIREMLDENHHELDVNPLSRLPGTRSCVARVERAVHSGTSFSLCWIDLIHLADFNTQFGDSEGDEIISKLAQIITQAIKAAGCPDDFLGHLGGDNFLVLTRSEFAPRISEIIIQEFAEVVEKLKTHPRVRSQVPFDGLALFASIAIVDIKEGSNATVQSLGRIAGELKRHLGNVRSGCYIRYAVVDGRENFSDDEVLEARVPGKAKGIRLSDEGLRSERDRAFSDVLKHRAINVLFQPLVELRSGKVIGFEVLSRPQSDFFHDANGLFAAARELHRVTELDAVCLERAFESAQSLDPGQKLFLNLNHETLLDPEGLEAIFAHRGSVGFKNCVIEITEQSILRSFDKVREALAPLQKEGILVAIDDVGGGAVSLRDVAVLKPDYIKFDRSLIRQLHLNTTKQQIVLSMIVFAKGIHAMTSAEGIQTREEYDAAMMCGIDLGQGFFIGKPECTYHGITCVKGDLKSGRK